MAIDGISGIEALAQLGFTAEQFSNFSLISSLVNQALAYGTLLQTVSGASALISAGIKLGLSERSIVNQAHHQSVAGQEILDNFARGFTLDPLNWNGSLLHAIGKSLWTSADSSRRNLKLQSNFARLVEEGRWRLQTTESVNAGQDSGQIITSFGAPGGAHQRACSDWMLPLVLGLSGDITPAWRRDLG
ncbi:VP3 [Lyfec polyomavirus MAF4]|nr:VP3 [Lyfec polyomavirus MAF4]